MKSLSWPALKMPTIKQSSKGPPARDNSTQSRWAKNAGWILVPIPAAVIILLALIRPSPTEQIEQHTQLFLERLKTEDTENLKEVFSASLSQRFTSQAMLDFAQQENITPLTNWTLINTHHFKANGVAHAQTPNGLIRFDYIGKISGWKLQNFCQVDSFVEDTAVGFIKHLRAGDLSAAQNMTVDTAFPGRQGRQFPTKRLQSLHQIIQGTSEQQTERLSLHEYYKYHQPIQTNDNRWIVDLHHWHYDRSGCRFFIYDIKQINK